MYLILSAFDALGPAARDDYETLNNLSLGVPSTKVIPVPDSFFNRPLWIKERMVPEGMQEVVEKWREILSALKLQDIYERYMHWGLKRRPNAVARQQYKDEIDALILKMGLELPDPNKGRLYT